jgi:hypothetical protein
MSDISALSHDYESSAKLAEDLNEAILIIKKARLHGTPDLPLDRRKTIASTVRNVRLQLDPEGQNLQEEFVPPEIASRLTERQGQQLAYFLEDLQKVEAALAEESSPLDEKAIEVLDEICDAADATASAVFRRMRRR